MDGRGQPYQPSAPEGRERLVTVGRQPADQGQARAWLAQFDREAASIAAQLAVDAPAADGPGTDDAWRRRAARALEIKGMEIARLEGWLLRHAPGQLGSLAGGTGAGAPGAGVATPDDLARWECAVFEGRGRGA